MFMSVVMGLLVLRLVGLLAHIVVTRFMRGLVDLFGFAALLGCYGLLELCL